MNKSKYLEKKDRSLDLEIVIVKNYRKRIYLRNYVLFIHFDFLDY